MAKLEICAFRALDSLFVLEGLLLSLAPPRRTQLQILVEHLVAHRLFKRLVAERRGCDKRWNYRCDRMNTDVAATRREILLLDDSGITVVFAVVL
jgi:hypothetical protein